MVKTEYYSANCQLSSMYWPVFIILLTVSIAAGDGPATLKSITGNQSVVILTPNKIERVCSTDLKIEVENLPDLPNTICCDFIINNQIISTKGYYKIHKYESSIGFQCYTSTYTTSVNRECFPPIAEGQHSITTTLSVSPRTGSSCTGDRNLTAGNDILTTNFTFFDCTTYTSCTQCLSSEFPCVWSETYHHCDHGNKKEADRAQILTQCDKYPTINGSTEILVISNSSKPVNVSLSTSNNQPFIKEFRHKTFFCQFNIENVRESVKAKFIDDNVISCNPTQFSYLSNVSHINASFTVLWLDQHKYNFYYFGIKDSYNNTLDNPNNVHLVIYRFKPSITSVVSNTQYWQNKCPKGTPAGGTNIYVFGSNLDNVQEPKIYVLYKLNRYVSACEVKSSSHMKCAAPTINVPVENLDTDHPKKLEYGFEMDPFAGFHNMSRKLNNFFELFPDPIYEPFDNENQNIRSDLYLIINGRFLDLASSENDVSVRVGIGFCNITSIARTQLTCKPPTEQPPNSQNDNKEDLPHVTVIVGNTLKFYIGKLNYSQPGILTENVLYACIAIIIVLFLTSLAFLIAYRCKSTEKTFVLEQMQKEMQITEQCVAAACKETFVELQTNNTDFVRDLATDCIPFLDYKTYVMRTLFPNDEQHRLLRFERPEVSFQDKELRFFEKLVMNKKFLLQFIQTLESNSNFSMSDRVHLASLLMIALQSNMQYCTDILTTLLAKLIEKCMQRKSHPKLLLRRTESVAEKMLSSWFTFLLYKFLRGHAGEPLYHLFRAIKYQVEKGPVDAITGDARFALSEDKLIRNFIDFQPMTVSVSIGRYDKIPVDVLSCDTICQVKEKSLDTIYRTTPFSQRPFGKENLDVEWKNGNTGKLILYDFDTGSKEGDWERMNTLNYYNVPDGAHLTLVPKERNSCILDVMDIQTVMTKKWHLVRQHDNADQNEGEKSQKLVSEIFLMRLLTTKGALQKFVDDLFRAIFTSGDHASAMPLAIKYMFDFLDNQALKHNLTDPDIVHTWKSNALPLRFWVNLIKNPDFLFDIHKNMNTLDTCLSGVAQAFVNACSTSDHKLSTHSPSSRLIFAREIPGYSEMVNKYYSEIKSLQKISDQDMNAMLAEESQIYKSQFNTNWALHELYTYVTKYNEQLTGALEKDLAQMLEQVHSMMKAD